MLYVGKAKSLRKRLQSYTKTPQLSDRIRQMTLTATQVQWQVLGSELLAVITEAELIGTYQPPFNILLKDDKSPLYLCLTKDDYPKLLQLRKGELDRQKYQATFGPYPSAYQLRQVLKLIRPIFKWCDQPIDPSRHPDPDEIWTGASNSVAHQPNLKQSLESKPLKPCFYYHLDRCSGACIGTISPTDYQESLQQLSLFLRGQSSILIKQLKHDMQLAAKTQEYEQAVLLRDRLLAVQQITTIGKLRPDPTTLSLHSNSATDRLTYLRRLLVLELALPKNYPLTRIEGYDVSNTSGQLASVSQVVFTNGEPDSAEYRQYHIRTLTQPNDAGMLREVMLRRQNHPEWMPPDLIIIDGGRGQLRAVLSVMKWQIPLIGIAKKPDRLLFPHVQSATDHQTKALSKSRKTVSLKPHLPSITYTELKLPPDHPALQLVAAIRNEAHRFSRRSHFRRREKALIKIS